MFELIFNENEIEFISNQSPKNKLLIKNKLLDLQNGDFTGDKALKGKLKELFAKELVIFVLFIIKDKTSFAS